MARRKTKRGKRGKKERKDVQVNNRVRGNGFEEAL